MRKRASMELISYDSCFVRAAFDPRSASGRFGWVGESELCEPGVDGEAVLLGALPAEPAPGDVGSASAFVADPLVVGFDPAQLGAFGVVGGHWKIGAVSPAVSVVDFGDPRGYVIRFRCMRAPVAHPHL